MSTTLLENAVVVRDKHGITSYQLDEYTRWLCLLEAIEHIEHKAKDAKLNLDQDVNWIQPIAMQKYVRERFISMKYDVVAALGGDTSKIRAKASPTRR